MKKYILIGIAVLVVVLMVITLTSGSANIETKHYENGEISFDYPSSWQQVPTKGAQIVAFKDPETGMNITVNRQVPPEGYNVSTDFVPELVKEPESNLKLTSSDKIDVKGNTGYYNSYQVQGNGSPLEQKEIWVNTNGALYSVVFNYPPEEFRAESLLKGFEGSKTSAAVDAVKNSLQIKLGPAR